MFEKRGVDVVAMFDVDEALICTQVGDMTILPLADLERYLAENQVDIAVFTMPKEQARGVAERLRAQNISGIWNFTGKELDMKDSGIVVESVHMGDSLMKLCYELCNRREGEEITEDED